MTGNTSYHPNIVFYLIVELKTFHQFITRFGEIWWSDALLFSEYRLRGRLQYKKASSSKLGSRAFNSMWDLVVSRFIPYWNTPMRHTVFYPILPNWYRITWTLALPILAGRRVQCEFIATHQHCPFLDLSPLIKTNVNILNTVFWLHHFTRSVAPFTNMV